MCSRWVLAIRPSHPSYYKRGSMPSVSMPLNAYLLFGKHCFGHVLPGRLQAGRHGEAVRSHEGRFRGAILTTRVEHRAHATIIIRRGGTSSVAFCFRKIEYSDASSCGAILTPEGEDVFFFFWNGRVVR